jgi:predicted nicotinamide N-methyase
MVFPVALQTITIGETLIELFVPGEEAVKQAYHERKISFPYWSKVWPSAIALSEFILQNPHYIQNKKLVEMGAGLGLPSIVAGRYAADVLCTDYVAEAVAIAQQSAAHNGLTNFETAIIDWRNLPNDFEADLLLLSDVNYEPSAFDELLQLVNDFLQKGTTIILSTPQRLMAKDFVQPLLEFSRAVENRAIESEGKEVLITILVLQAK